MISVILYGRNDAHGYNLHRRAALSLNCLAEVLTDRGDEILFVDYNTPDELPTFVEALSDTLTDRCTSVLRVLRVRASIHKQLFADRTHLSAIEPVARNAAVRRANPANRWLLSTNTDMILLPLSDRSLSEICTDLPDGFFAMPRFELPEWLWERLPRSDPERAMKEVARVGPRLRLDEPTVSYEWIRFDAPGDFQLFLREDFIDIDGFNEEMLLGYHVDSNLSRRMLLHRGSIESLGDHVAGYHCNHSRTPTVYHGARPIMNDLDRFFYSVDTADLPDQRTTWGLASFELEELSLPGRRQLDVAERIASILPSETTTRAPSDALAAGFGLTYDSGHVLPFIADSLIVSPTDITVGYIGANPVLVNLLARLVSELGIANPLEVADLDRLASIDKLSARTDVVVVDLGVDGELGVPMPAAVTHYDLLELPPRLDRAFAEFQRFVQLERSRLGRGAHPRRIVLVNSATAFWDAYVLAQLDCSHTTVHSRVRRATVKPVPDESTTAVASQEAASQLVRWAARKHARDGRLHLRGDRRVAVARLQHFAGFGDGWAYPDGLGVWTLGGRSDLAVALDGGEQHSVLALAIGGVCVAPDDSLVVELVVDGEPLTVREFRQDQWNYTLPSLPFRRPVPPRVVQAAKTVLPPAVADRVRPIYWRLAAPSTGHAQGWHLRETIWRVRLPDDAIARGSADVSFLTDEPRTPRIVGWSDDERPLGFHLRSVGLERVDAPHRLPRAEESLARGAAS